MLVRVSEVALDYVEDATRYNLEVEGDNSFVVDVIAHNSNRNRDRFYGHPREVEFPEPKGKKSVKLQTGNASQAWTFERYAKVYRDHKNRKTDKAYGDVIKAAHNARWPGGLLSNCPRRPVWTTSRKWRQAAFLACHAPRTPLVRTMEPLAEHQGRCSVWTSVESRGYRHHVAARAVLMPARAAWA